MAPGLCVDYLRQQTDANAICGRTAVVQLVSYFEHWSQRETDMLANEGTIDRIVRVAAGLGILSLAVIGPQSPWAWVGLVPLATGLVGYCPAYSILGVRTCPMPKSK